MASALEDIAVERRRQIEAEGWTPEHDDAHGFGQMALAAGSYAIHAASNSAYFYQGESPPRTWPWQRAWWKPTDRRRDLVKAGALIVAEIERLDRSLSRPTPPLNPSEREG